MSVFWTVGLQGCLLPLKYGVQYDIQPTDSYSQSESQLDSKTK